MQRRSTVLKTKLAQANHELQLAVNSRSSSVMIVSQNPGDDKAHAELDAAITAVPLLQKRVEALESATHEAERLDRIDEIESKRKRLLASRDEAIKLAAARKPIAKELQVNIDALAATLKKFEVANDETLLAIHNATSGAAPHAEHDASVFGQRVHLIAGAVTSALRSAFLTALQDAGVGEIGIDLNGVLGPINPHGDRGGLVAAVEKSAMTITQTLDFLHKSVGLLPADPVEEAEPAIAPPTETVLPDGSIYTIDAVVVEWGAPQ